MTTELPHVVPTRLADMSGLGLADVIRRTPDDMARVSAPLVREVTSQTEVSLAGSNS
jgi:hypothetical protein